MAYNDPLKRVRAAHDSGSRSTSVITTIVLHSTEGDTAAGAASWFANPSSLGSAHIAVDDEEGYRCVPDDVIAWGASGANTQGLHMEHAARAAWKRAVWINPAGRKMLKRSAYRVARWCKLYGIPPRYLTVAELRQNKRGIAMHYQVSTAFHASTHTDPGKGFPKRRYRRYVKKFLREM